MKEMVFRNYETFLPIKFYMGDTSTHEVIKAKEIEKYQCQWKVMKSLKLFTLRPYMSLD
jgi:hypothetical protein